MKILSIIAMVLLFAVFTVHLMAQKIGYVDMQEIIGSMPEKTKSDSTLMAYRRAIYAQVQQMDSTYQQDVAEFVQDSGSLDEMKRDVVRQKLLDQQRRLVDFQRTVGQRIAKKQAALRKPLIEKAKSAMNTVAKTKGFPYIVNDFYYPDGTPFVLIKPESADLTKAVKAQLGIIGQ